MNLKEYPHLGEFVYEAKLSNGLAVRVVKKPGFAKTYAFLAVDYGSIDTRFSLNGDCYVTPNGVAHYLEHKMFDMPECNASQLFASYGGSPNAFTSYDITAYYVECTDCFRENLEILLRFVTTPYFTEESVEKEQEIIAQEIRMYEDSPDSCVFENLYECLYAHHPIRVPIAGTVESIRDITAETLYDCHRAFYRADQMMLVVVGDIDPLLVAEAAERIVPLAKEGKPIRDYGSHEKMRPFRNKAAGRMEVAMPMFALGFKTEPVSYGKEAMVQEVVGDMAAEMLCGESAPLFEQMYRKNLIDSSFAVEYEGLKQAGALTCSGDSDSPYGVYDEIMLEAERIQKYGLDYELFLRLKKSSLGRRIRNLDSFESICYRMCAYYFEGMDYYDFPDVYQSVTMDQVAEFLRRTVVSDRAAMSVINPIHEGG